MEPQARPRGQSFQKNRFVVSRESTSDIKNPPISHLTPQIRNPSPSRSRKIFTISVIPKDQNQSSKTSSTLSGNEYSSEDSKDHQSLQAPMPRAKKQFHITRTNNQSTELWDIFNFPQRNSTGSSSSSGNLSKSPVVPQSKSDYDPLIDIF